MIEKISFLLINLLSIPFVYGREFFLWTKAETFFSLAFNATLISSIIIPFVLIARYFLQKAPKIYSYSLWLVVFIRLLLPFSVKSKFSFLPLNTNPITPHLYTPDSADHITTAIPEIFAPIAPDILEKSPEVAETTLEFWENWQSVASVVWWIGVAVMGVVALVSFGKLKWSLVGCTPLESFGKNPVFLADNIQTPFVLGLFHPKIYLPSTISQVEIPFILAHERHHIKRKDHITRCFAFLALTIHWFNPLVWLAFFLSQKDMELSCDEEVLKTESSERKREYASALVRFSSEKPMITPLAFSENDVKGRVENIFTFQKAKIWVRFSAALLVLGLLVGFGTSNQYRAFDPQFPAIYVDHFLQNYYLGTKESPFLQEIRTTEVVPEYFNGYEMDGEMTYFDFYVEGLPTAHKILPKEWFEEKYPTFSTQDTPSAQEAYIQQFHLLELSEEVQTRIIQLMNAYRPHLSYQIVESNQVVPTQDAIDTEWSFEAYAEAENIAVIYTNVTLEIQPLDVYQGRSQGDLDLLWAEFAENTAYSSQSEKINGYYNALLDQLLPTASTPQYKAPVQYQVQTYFLQDYGHYEIYETQPYGMHLYSLLCTFYDYQRKF